MSLCSTSSSCAKNVAHFSQTHSSQTNNSQSQADAYVLRYHDNDGSEQHITCKTMYDALVWAREEAHEHAANVHIYKLCHVELAP